MELEGAGRRLAAIMFTDIVGSTAVTARSESAGLALRDRHRELVRTQIERYHGRFIEAPGDESLSTFESAVDAVHAALAIQQQLAGDPELQVRIGVHLGETIFRGDEVFGDGVNIAARVRELAEPGQILVSGEVARAVQNQPNVETFPRGEHKLKGVAGSVMVHEVSGRAAEPGLAPKTVVQPTRAAGPWFTATGVAVLLAVVALAWWSWNRASTTPAPIRSIAVLPLENLSGDPEQEYFVDGMTESLISMLSKIKELRVISRTSSMAYRDSDKTLPQIARELNVDAVVEGSVLRAGDRVRITAQLIQASSDEHLWSDSYERDLKNVLALQREVAKAIAGEIELKLSRPEEPGKSARPVDPGAFEAYLKGRHHWNKRTGADLRKSIKYFETAIALDPDWALAHSGLAEAYVLLANYDPSVRPRDSMPRARAAAERALELDDELAPAHTALAAVRNWYDWDWEGAEAEFQRAIELDPSYATAHLWYSILRVVTKKKDAIEHIQRARALDPLSMVIARNVGSILFYAREYDRSIEALRKSLEFDPSSRAQADLARAYAAKGMHKEAVEVAERLARIAPEFHRSMVTLAQAYAGAGRREDALRILEEVRGSAGHVNVAYVYAALGEADAAFEWLEKAYERRSGRLGWLPVEPVLDPLRSDPRFDDLLRRIGFPES